MDKYTFFGKKDPIYSHSLISAIAAYLAKNIYKAKNTTTANRLYFDISVGTKNDDITNIDNKITYIAK